jgi:hypothetical protein
VEFCSVPLKLTDAEGSALVGTELVGRRAANCKREVTIVVLLNNNRRSSVVERAGAALAESRIHAITHPLECG